MKLLIILLGVSISLMGMPSFDTDKRVEEIVLIDEKKANDRQPISSQEFIAHLKKLNCTCCSREQGCYCGIPDCGDNEAGQCVFTSFICYFMCLPSEKD